MAGGHTANAPLAKILEAIWWKLDAYTALNTFMDDPARNGTPHRYRVFDGKIMHGGEVMASECPALTIEVSGGQSLPLHDVAQEGNIIACNPVALWSLDIWGYLNTLSFDLINEYYTLVFQALVEGGKTAFADSAQGLLQGTDQLIRSFEWQGSIPGALWINPSNIERSRNKPDVSFFMIGMSLDLDDAVGVIG